MRMFRFARVLIALLLFGGLIVSFAPQVVRPAPASANVLPPVSVCGTVQEYVAATPFAPGVLVLGGITYPISPGVSLTNSSLIVAGTTVCLNALLTGGTITSGTITLTSTSPGTTGAGALRICGSVQTYLPPSGFVPGLVTIGGESFTIAPGAVFVGGGAIQLGNDICLLATVGSNLVIIGGSVTPDVNLTLVICGPVANFLAPVVGGAPGMVTINGTTYFINQNAALTGVALVSSGTTLCFNGALNGPGQIISGTFTAPFGTTAPLSVCGVVTGYVPPSATVVGSVGIGGTPYPIAAGATLTGAGMISIGANICIQGTLNSAGQLTTGTITFNGGVSVTVCGLISAYTVPTGTIGGSITIAGITFPIAAGAAITGGAVTAPSTLGITVVLNGQGAISGGTITANTCTVSSVSGPVTAYIPPTATTAGSITIGGITYTVAAGVTLTINNGVPLAASPLHHAYHPGMTRPE